MFFFSLQTLLQMILLFAAASPGLLLLLLRRTLSVLPGGFWTGVCVYVCGAVRKIISKKLLNHSFMV